MFYSAHNNADKWDLGQYSQMAFCLLLLACCMFYQPMLRFSLHYAHAFCICTCIAVSLLLMFHSFVSYIALVISQYAMCHCSFGVCVFNSPLLSVSCKVQCGSFTLQVVTIIVPVATPMQPQCVSFMLYEVGIILQS